MLGKLIRYDGKLQLKFLGSLCIAAVLINLFACFAGFLYEAYPKVTVFNMFRLITVAFGILAVAAMVGGNTIYAVIRFRKNMFRDEGYLMHTLPVTETQLFFSKLIISTASVYLSGAAAYLCVCIGTRRWDYITKWMEMLRVSGMEKEMWTIILTFLVILLLIPVTLCQFYAALTMGYTWKSGSGNPVSRDLLSIVSYIVLYMIQQALGLIGIVFYLVINFGNPLSVDFINHMNEMESSQGVIMSYVQGMVAMAFGLDLFLGIALIAVILRRLNHHLNLE